MNRFKKKTLILLFHLCNFSLNNHIAIWGKYTPYRLRLVQALVFDTQGLM